MRFTATSELRTRGPERITESSGSAQKKYHGCTTGLSTVNAAIVQATAAMPAGLTPGGG